MASMTSSVSTLYFAIENQISCMCVIFMAWTFVLSLPFSHSRSCIENFDHNDMCDESYGEVLQERAAPSLTGCCTTCLRNSDCYSVVFNPLTQFCRHNSGRTGRFSTDCANTVSYASVRKSTCRSVLFGTCNNDSDCTAVNSRCYNGTCECMWGYSYNPSNLSCLASCDVYGTTFAVIPNYGLAWLTSQTLENVTPDEAMAHCINSTSFTCRSISCQDPIGSTCYLSNETSLTAPTSFMYIPSYYLMYLQRNCK